MNRHRRLPGPSRGGQAPVRAGIRVEGTVRLIPSWASASPSVPPRVAHLHCPLSSPGSCHECPACSQATAHAAGSLAGDPGQVQVSRMAMFLSRGDLVLLRAAASIRPGSRARSSCFGRRNRKTPFAPASMPFAAGDNRFHRHCCHVSLSTVLPSPVQECRGNSYLTARRDYDFRAQVVT